MQKQSKLQKKPKFRKSGQLRRSAILRAATEEFMARGYERATLSAIVSNSGGSRETLYRLFGGKSGLFLTVILDHATDILSAFNEETENYVFSLPFDQALHAFAEKFLRTLLAPETVALMRVAFFEAQHFAGLGEELYKGAPSLTAKNVADFFRRESERGTVKIENPDVTARCFLNMIQGDLYIRALLAPLAQPTEKEIRECATVAVNLFLRGVAV